MLVVKQNNAQAVEEGQKFVASQNAKFRSAVNKQNYTTQQKDQAVKVRDLLDYAFTYDNLFITYRKAFIAVKVENAVIKNNNLLKQVFDLFEEYKYEVVQTPQGIIVRIPKQ